MVSLNPGLNRSRLSQLLFVPVSVIRLSQTSPNAFTRGCRRSVPTVVTGRMTVIGGAARVLPPPWNNRTTSHNSIPAMNTRQIACNRPISIRAKRSLSHAVITRTGRQFAMTLPIASTRNLPLSLVFLIRIIFIFTRPSLTAVPLSNPGSRPPSTARSGNHVDCYPNATHRAGTPPSPGRASLCSSSG